MFSTEALQLEKIIPIVFLSGRKLHFIGYYFTLFPELLHSCTHTKKHTCVV